MASSEALIDMATGGLCECFGIERQERRKSTKGGVTVAVFSLHSRSYLFLVKQILSAIPDPYTEYPRVQIFGCNFIEAKL